MTPAQKAGIEVGDKVRVIEGSGYFMQGELVTLHKDDGSSCPWWLKEDGSDWWAGWVSNVEKVQD